MQQWTLTSWRQFENFQPIQYTNDALRRLPAVLAQLSSSQPLVPIECVQQLSQRLSAVCQGDGFVLQGGDCAECFIDLSQSHVHAQVQLLMELSQQLYQYIGEPVLPIGRIAGQFAKPRSELLERVNEAAIPRYRGDMINEAVASAAARQLDPERLLIAYDMAKLCWSFIESSLLPDLTSSHEALHLDFEQALTRQGEDGLYYNVSTHFPWVGMRTALPDSAHIEYLRGIANPVAIKVGPNLTERALQDLVDRLNPGGVPGRLSLIYRLGQSRIQQRLPKIIDAVNATGIPVLWLCDPMHGNTITTAMGIKTRHCAEMQDELLQAMEVHDQLGVRMHGLHLEMTHKAVTECIGGGAVSEERHLDRAYDSPVDPRLNPEQARFLIQVMNVCRIVHVK